MLRFGRRPAGQTRGPARPFRPWETLEGRVLFSTVLANDETPNAPPLTTTIEGTNIDEDASANNGLTHNIPDPSGAVGPDHLVSVVRSSIQFFTKAGAASIPQRLGRDTFGSVAGSFFEPLNPATDLFQPKVIFDQYEQRFVVMALDRTDTAFGDPVNNSRILVAASDDADPNGTWRYQAISSNITVNGAFRFAANPGLAVDDNAVFLTADMLAYGATNNTFQGSRLWILDKANLYAGTGNSAVTIHDPATAAGVPNSARGLQPAHMFGAAPGTTGTFLVSFVESGAADTLTVIRLANPLTAPAFTNTAIPLGNVTDTYTPNDAPQPNDPEQIRGPATIDTGDARIGNAVWRNGNLYAAHTVNATSGADVGTATARWYRVTATASTVAAADQGNVGGEDIAAATRTYFPSVSVDGSDNMGIGFAASGPTVFLGAYYTGRVANAPAGTTQPASALAAGLDFYFRPFDVNGTGVNTTPWGSYSSLAVDPSDNGSTLWAFNAYALEGGTVLPPPFPQDEDGRWGTRFGQFMLGGTDATPPTVSAVYLDSTGWNAAFRQFLQTSGQGSATLGFQVPGGIAQVDEMTWRNVNVVRIQFSEDVSVQQADLAIRGVNVLNYNLGPAANFVYDAATRTASWTLGGGAFFANDKILLDLDGDTATGGVADPAGNLLDGEWTNPTETTPPTGDDAFPSGNGAPGGDFRFRINMLPADVNRNGGVVNSIDLQQTRIRQFLSPSNPGTEPVTYTAFHDIDGNAFINSIDLQNVRIRQFTRLPDGTPTLVAPTARRLSPASLFGTTAIRTGRAVDELLR